MGDILDTTVRETGRLMVDRIAQLPRAQFDSLIAGLDDAALLDQVGSTMIARRQFDRAITACRSAIARDPDLADAYRNLAAAHEFRSEDAAAHKVYTALARRKHADSTAPVEHLPAPVMFALPKSASTFLAEAVGRSLGLPVSTGIMASRDPTLSPDIFPKAYLVEEAFRILARRPRVLKCHAHGRAHNLKVVRNAGVSKLLVHVRDPRQTLLSYFYHCQRGRGLIRAQLADPSFPELDRAGQLDWLLQHYYPLQLNWIDSWLAAADDPREPAIMLSDFDRMRAVGEVAFVRDICDFLGAGDAPIVIPEKSSATRFRKGSTGEWRDAFDDRQQAWMWAQISPRMRDRFAWRP